MLGSTLPGMGSLCVRRASRSARLSMRFPALHQGIARHALLSRDSNPSPPQSLDLSGAYSIFQSRNATEKLHELTVLPIRSCGSTRSPCIHRNGACAVRSRRRNHVPLYEWPADRCDL